MEQELSPYEKFIAEWKADIQRTQQWRPPITRKQAMMAEFPERFVLASGPRHSTKTISTLYALVTHAWTIPDASIAFVAISQTNAADSGAWVDLTNQVLPTWIAGGFGMQWIQEPRVTTHTHKNYCEVSNQYGGCARIQLYTLADEREVEALFKNKSFTMVYITELSKFVRVETFTTLIQTFRGIGRPAHHFKFMADTNPADEGTESWIWKFWYGIKALPELNDFQRQFRLLEFSLDDNPFYSEQEKQIIRQSFEHDQDLYRRMILGEWLRVADGTYFQEVFHRSLHVIPPEHVRDEEMGLQEGCSSLLTGTDIGSGINHSAHIIEPFWHGGRKCYKVLDEIISVGLEISIEEFTQFIVERMDYWEKEAREKEAAKRIFWQHWSDADVFNYTATAKTHKHKIVFAASAGRIELHAADKGPGSVLPRLSMLKQLMHQDRLFLNRTCVKTIHAIQNLKKLPPSRMASRTNPIDPRDPLKHPIDSLSYAILMDMGEEAHAAMMISTKKLPPPIIDLEL